MNKQEAIKRIKELYGYGSRAKTVTDIISQIHEPQKVVVPKFIADWYDYAKKQNFSLSSALEHWSMSEEVEKWFSYSYNQETFARAWLDGYEVEKEKLYTVKVVGTGQYLVERYEEQGYVFIYTEYPLSFTKSELEAVGFGGVFDNPMFEVVEVE